MKKGNKSEQAKKKIIKQNEKCIYTQSKKNGQKINAKIE